MTNASRRGSAVCDQNAVIFHPLDRCFKQLDPLPVARGQRGARRVVGLRQLCGQGVVGRRAARGSDAPEVAHVEVDPPFEVVERVQVPKLGLAMKVQHHPDLAPDDRADAARFCR